MDYKIATRAISGRLLGVISSIVGSDQMCGIPGRTISENLTLICDLIEYADRADLPLALLSLNQEKAFDRVDWAFLQRILAKFGFGDSFRPWIGLFYTDVESAVVIHGWTSFFKPSCGVRQGFPLSPLLCVLCIEALACSITAAPNIEGVKLEKRLSAWKGRQLAFQGKATVINTLALSQLWHLCHVFVVPEWAVKLRRPFGVSSGPGGRSWSPDAPFVCLRLRVVLGS